MKKNFSSDSSKDIPYLTAEQMVEVDRAMIEDYHIELIQMMENAGRNLAYLSRSRFFEGDSVEKKVVFLVGTGGNGGGAMVCARRLHCWGARVQVILTKSPEDYNGIPMHQLDILQRIDVPVGQPKDLEHIKAADLIIDGIIGYSLSGDPKGEAADLIRWANELNVPVLALDTPSGVDTTSGTAFKPAINATATLTLALPKEGLRAPEALKHVGELYLADIGVPPGLYTKLGLNIKLHNLFSKNEIIRLR